MQAYLNPVKNRIDLDFPFNFGTINQLRGIGAKFDGMEKKWWVGLNLAAVEDLKITFPYVYMDDRIKQWSAVMSSKSSLNQDKKLRKSYSPIIDTIKFKTEPRLHQKISLDLLYNNHYFALLHEMGSGKTKSIIDLISYMKSKGEFTRALIVAPLSVVGNWPKEVEKHADGLTCSIMVGDRYQRTKALEKPADIYIINYQGMRIMGDTLKAMDWDVMVCDESQNIKNRTAQQSKACYAVGKKSKRRYILTGTLVHNKPLDAFGQFKFLSESILGGNYFAFQSRYAIMNVYGKGSYPVRYVNLEDLADKLEPWSYRVLKKDCLDLPDKIFETRYAEFHPEAKRVYKEVMTDLAAELRSGDYVTAPIILVKLLRFQQLTAGFVTTMAKEEKEIGEREKIKVLLDVLDEAEGKCVVWTKFRKEMAMVKESLDKAGIVYVSIDGSIRQEDRQKAIDRFHGDDGVKVFLSQTEVGGTGIDLTPANTCIYMTNSYSLGTRLQSEDRLHRQGQKKPVTYVDIVVPGTIDEKVLAMLHNKQDIANLINKDIALELIGGTDA